MALDVLTVGTCLVELTSGQSGVNIAQAPYLKKIASGSAALFAFAAARLGVRPGLLSAVGDDELAEFFLDELKHRNVDGSQVRRVPGQLTSLSLASADGRGGKTFWFYRFSGHSDPLETLESADVSDDVLRSTRLFDFTESSLRQGGRMRESVFDLARRSRSFGQQVCYAPNWRPVLWREDEAGARAVQQQAVAASDLVILNQEEVCVIAGDSDPAAAARILGSLGAHTVVVTCGGDQPVKVWHRGEMQLVPIYRVEMRYDVGAGDTFHSGFVAGYLRGLHPFEAARFASAVAALKITRPPDLDNLPTLQEVEEFMAP